jgi:hypothetical protein
MRKFILAMSLFFAVVACSDKKDGTAIPEPNHDTSMYFYYGSNNEKIYLLLDTRHATFYSMEPILYSDIIQRGIISRGFFLYGQYKGIPIPDGYWWTELSIDKELSNKEYLELLSDIKRKNSDIIIAPYLKDQYGKKWGICHVFYVKLKSESDATLLERMAEQNNCIIISQDFYDPLWFTLSVNEASELNALEYANLFHESSLFEYAQPAFVFDYDVENNYSILPSTEYSFWGTSCYWNYTKINFNKVTVINSEEEL